MSNHWHFVLWPEREGQMTDFLRWLTHTHTRRWHAHYHTAGTGHVYQGRFKAFPVQEDSHLLTVLRYVERNPLRAGLVPHARSTGVGRASGVGPLRTPTRSQRRCTLARCDCPGSGLSTLIGRKRRVSWKPCGLCTARGRPFGSTRWQERMAKDLGLEFTFRERGRPKKETSEG